MQSNISKNAMLNGLFIGLLLSLKFIFSVQKYNFFAFLTIAISVFIIFTLFRLTIRLRENEFGGVITYKQSFQYIFLIYFYGSIISSLVMLIYTKFIDSVFLQTMLDTQLKFYETLKLHIDDQTYNLLEKIYKPAGFSMLNIFSGLLGGAFWSLILSAFIKKEKNIFE